MESEAVRHTAEQWRIDSSGLTILADDVDVNNGSSCGDIVCECPAEGPSLEHWAYRRELIARAPDLLREVTELRAEKETAKQFAAQARKDRDEQLSDLRGEVTELRAQVAAMKIDAKKDFDRINELEDFIAENGLFESQNP